MPREEDIQLVLGNIRHRWPGSTREDAISILRDAAAEEAQERRSEQRDASARAAELDWMAAQ